MKIATVLGAVFMMAMTMLLAPRWPFGAANTITASVTDDTITISDEIVRGVNLITVAVDTTSWITATNLSTGLAVGDLVYVKLVESTNNGDSVHWITGFTGLWDTLPPSKTKLVTFVYDGSNLLKLASTQVN